MAAALYGDGAGRSTVLARAAGARGNPALPQLVTTLGDLGLPSPFPVGELALGAVGAQRLAAEEWPLVVVVRCRRWCGTPGMWVWRS